MNTPISRRDFVKTSRFAPGAVPLALGAQTPPASQSPDQRVSTIRTALFNQA
ncbi:MAG: twin-arginine translocation signal domain-containing protein [Verrucomicrobia bacterium]|nr:twin-arginine translocation signal domain-containing protein [Verrucomicrobiota bacterium]